MSEQKSFQAVLDSVPNIVDFLYKNPPKSALNVFTVMMPAEVVRPEFTTWRDEQRSWRETIALHDQSYHMNSLHVRGSRGVAALREPRRSTRSRPSSPAQPSSSSRAHRRATSSATRSSTTSSQSTSFSSGILPPPTGSSSTASAARSTSRPSSIRSGCSTASDRRSFYRYQVEGPVCPRASREAPRRPTSRDQVLPLRLDHDRRLSRTGHASQHGRRSRPRVVGAVG